MTDREHKQDKSLELQFNIAYQASLNIPAIIFILFGVAVLHEGGLTDVKAVFMALSCFSISGVLIYPYGPAFLSRAKAFRMDENGIHRLRWSLQWELIPWDEINSITDLSLSSTDNYFQINTNQGVTFRIPSGAWLVDASTISSALSYFHGEYRDSRKGGSELLNPYQPPESNIGDDDRITGKVGMLYHVINVIYAFIIIASTVILIAGGNLIIDMVSIYVLVAFYAPIFSYVMVIKKDTRNMSIYIKVHALILFILVGVYVYNLQDMGLNQGIGYFIILVNVASFISSMHKTRIMIG